MSEVGKIFDSILDYKIRKESAAYKAIEETLIECTINSIGKETLEFIKLFKERKEIYNYEVCCDEVNNTYTTSIPPIDITVPVSHIQLKCLIDKNGAYFEEILKEIGEEKGHKTYLPTENKENLGQLTVYENFVEPTETTKLELITSNTTGLTFSEFQEKVNKDRIYGIAHTTIKSSEQENDYYSGVIKEEYDAKVKEGNITLDFYEDSSKSTLGLLNEWVKVSKYYEKDTNTEKYGISNDFLVSLTIDSKADPITGKYVNGLTFGEMVEAKHSLPYKMNGYMCIIYDNQTYAQILEA